MVGEPVEQRAGEPFAAQHLGPVLERQVGGDDRRATFVSLWEKTSNSSSAPGRRKRHVAKLVDDEQLHRCKIALELEQAPLVARFHQLADQRGRGRERNGKAPSDRPPRPSASATWVLPVPLLPSAIMFSRRRTYSQRASSRTSILLRLGDGGEVERVEALHRREPCCPDAPLDRAPFAVDQLELDQPQQVAGMVGAVTRALAGHLVILAQHRRQLQLLEVMGEQHLRRGAIHRARRHRVGCSAHAASTP